MITEALLSLRPGAKWSMNGEDYDQLVWADTEQTKPTKSEVMVEVERLKIEVERNKYQNQRYYEYPSVREQLDALYHDIKTGNLESGTWIAAIEAVKEKYPKPE